MYDDACILTTKDLTILEVVSDRCGPDDPLLPLLRRKIRNATVVLRDDVPDTVATLSSRISFRAGDGPDETRVLSLGRINGPVGMFLPLSTMRGLALLGMAEGQTCMIDEQGHEKPVTLLAVLYQPEAQRRARAVQPVPQRPRLRLVSGGAMAPEPSVAGDDPGPSAA